MVPIDENTMEHFLKKMESIFAIDEKELEIKYNRKTINTFKKIITILSHVNIKEFE